MLNTQQHHPVVLSYDPAIDVGKQIADTAAFTRYLQGREWRDLEPFLKPGAAPQIFHLRILSHAELLACSQGANAEARAVLAFRFACARVDNAQTRDGATVARLQPANGKQFDDNELQEFWRLGALVEIGMVAHARSFFDPAIGMPCELPHSSLAILRRLISRHAEPSAPMESNDSPKPSTDAAPPTSAKPAKQSARRGTAAVTG